MSLINVSSDCAGAEGVGVACGELRASGTGCGFSESATDFLQPITHSASAIVESCDNFRIITAPPATILDLDLVLLDAGDYAKGSGRARRDSLRSFAVILRSNACGR